MADLTSTITISGSVNGKRISFTHSYVMEDVYDVGVHDREDAGVTINTNNTGGGEAVTFSQDTPNYMLACNRSAIGVSLCNITSSGGSTIFILAPNSLVCLTGTAGLTAPGSIITNITLQDPDSISADNYPPMVPGRMSIFVAFNAST